MNTMILGLLAALVAASAGAEPIPWSTGVVYEYDGAGNVKKIGTDVHVYDVVGRLVQTQSTGITRNYEYDAFGNRIRCRHAPGTSVEGDCQPLTIDSATNRIAGVNRYDLAGNLVAVPGHTYWYDAVNMLVRHDSAVSREFVYTADDERIAIHNANTGTWQWTVRGLDGKPLREFTSRNADTVGTASWQWTRDYVWRDGLLLASKQPAGDGRTSTYHYHLDHLGTPRRITDSADLIVGSHDYYAFGPEHSTRTDEPALTPLKYTGHERDLLGSETAETLDYMHARYYSPGMGRFLSVDPELDPEKIKYEPQQWNRYSYVTNNPLKYTDPDGKDKFMAWLLGSAFKDVSTWDALKGALTGQHAGPSMSQAAGDWAEDHRQMTGGFSPVPTSKTEVAMIPVLMMLGPAGKTAFNGIITSAIKNDTLLVKAAQFAGKSHQGSLDNLVGALAKGNLNPGIGTKNLFGNVMYARARDGARVFFRQGRDGSIEILAKANKANEKQVIERLTELYK